MVRVHDNEIRAVFGIEQNFKNEACLIFNSEKVFLTKKITT